MSETNHKSLKVSLRELPSITVIFIHCSMDIPAGEFNEHIARGFDTAKDLAVRFGHDPSMHKVIGVPHVADGRLTGYDCCAEISPGAGMPDDVRMKTLEGGRYAVLTLDKDPVTIGISIERFFTVYVPQHDLSIDQDRVRYELYSGRVMELCTPIM